MDASGVAFENEVHTGALTVSKQVRGSTADGQRPFDFKIELAYEGLGGRYGYSIQWASGAKETGQMQFTSGKASTQIQLYAGDIFRIENLPVGTAWTISEVNIPEGFFTGYSVDGTLTMPDLAEYRDEASASGTIRQDGQTVEVVFTNFASVLLPTTGGSGTILYTAGGAALFLLALLMYRRKRLERGRETP